MQQLTASSLNDLPTIAKQLLELYPNNKIFCFTAQMGAGKTTFIKELCKQLQCLENTSSPTYSIVNEYKTKGNNIIYHFDCYRLKSLQEAINIGIEEYLYSNNYCFIEWSQLIKPILPNTFVEVSINVIENIRNFVFKQIT